MDDMYKDAYEIIKDENLFNLGLDSLNIVKPPHTKRFLSAEWSLVSKNISYFAFRNI